LGRRGGCVVSFAFTGPRWGGVLAPPAPLRWTDAQGFRRALATAALAQLAVLALAARVMGRGPADVGLGPDGDPALPSHRAAPAGEGAQWRRAAPRTWRFWSASAPLAPGLAAQVGVLTHVVALVAPVLGTSAAGRAVSAATAAAVLGRLGTGFVVDRLSRRGVASATLCIQMVGLALLAWAPSATV